MLKKIRVATLQYFIRPVQSLEQFRDQVEGLVRTAADYKCHLVVFPEYFTCQLLTLGNVRRPIAQQVRDLAQHEQFFVEMMERLARESSIHIVAGSIPVKEPGSDAIFNQCHVFTPDGLLGHQRKLHVTRFEAEEWLVSPGARLRLFDTDLGRIAVAICYDVEFPEIARAAARQGTSVLVVPSCTDDRQGYLRVRYCAHARAIENQLYVACSSTVGSLPMVPAVSLNWGQAAILTPSDFAFSRDGILAEGVPNQESMVIGDLDIPMLLSAREDGTVRPLRDSVRTADIIADMEIVKA